MRIEFFAKKNTQIQQQSAVEINEDFFYYPKNLRSKSQFLLWSFSDCVIMVVIICLCMFLWDYTRFHPLLTLPLVYAFLSARIEDINILTRIKEILDFMLKPNVFKNNSKPNSSQQLLGSKYISEDGRYFAETGRYVFWNVEPFNLAVLSPGAISILVNQMTSVLKQCSNLEILALDSARSLDENISFLKKRIEEETNPAVKKLLESDLAEISDKSQSANNSRKYLFILKIAPGKPVTQDLPLISRYTKIMQDNGLNAVQLLKPEIKKVLANYFDITTSDLPDIDGLQYRDEKGDDNLVW